MIPIPTLTALLFALAPALAHGQRPSWPATPEADSLAAFKARMFAYEPRREAPAPLAEYKLVWTEHHSGYAIGVQAVNDSTVLREFSESLRQVTPLMFPMFYGDRYALITEDIPVSMQDLTFYYYERR